MSFKFLCMICLTMLGAGPPDADYVLFNARIYTVRAPGARAEALAVQGDRFVAVGSNRDVLQDFPNARKIDARGLTVVPGFTDAHAHLQGLALKLLQADLVGTRSVQEVLDRLRAHAPSLPRDAWLVGRGWDQNDWANAEFPDRQMLDHAFPARPVWLRRIDGHAGWANSAALEAAGISASTPVPMGGRIIRSGRGEPTGILLDTAMDLIEQARPAADEAALGLALGRAVESLHQQGITGVHDAGSNLETIRRYERAVEAGELDLRLYVMTSGIGDAFEYFCREGPLLSFRDRLTVRSVKFYSDGALGSRGAALLEDYSDDAGNQGLLRQQQGELAEAVERAIACGFQVAIHAIGDRANRMALDVFEAVLEQEQRDRGRHRIEHAQVVHPEDLARFGRLGIIASVQPIHATSDMAWAESRLGRDRTMGAYAWRSLVDAGARIALGSDFPVEEVSPLEGIHAAVARQNMDGHPPGGWYGEQALTREEALRGFTLDAAYAAFLENDLGSIEPGKLADFVVLSADLMEVPEEQIPEVDVVATFVGGRRVSGGW